LDPEFGCSIERREKSRFRYLTRSIDQKALAKYKKIGSMSLENGYVHLKILKIKRRLRL
jgi:hypothetical protein